MVSNLCDLELQLKLWHGLVSKSSSSNGADSDLVNAMVALKLLIHLFHCFMSIPPLISSKFVCEFVHFSLS